MAKRKPDTARDVANFLLREKHAQERQIEWWREQVAVKVSRADRETLGEVAEVLAVPERPPAEWRSKREREIDALREDIESSERQLDDLRRSLEARSR